MQPRGQVARPRQGRGLAFLLALALAAGLRAGPPQGLLLARVRVLAPDCAATPLETVRRALAGASRILENGAGIRLSLTAETAAGVDSGYCHLPVERAARGAALAALSRAQKRADPGCLLLVLLPDDEEGRLSWASIDVSPLGGCGSPQEARFLDRFGVAYFSDAAWAPGAPGGDLLLAHEVLHALTMRGHPTGLGRGQVLADHLSDIGAAVDPDLAACARRSPYLRPLP